MRKHQNNSVTAVSVVFTIDSSKLLALYTRRICGTREDTSEGVRLQIDREMRPPPNVTVCYCRYRPRATTCQDMNVNEEVNVQISLL